MSSVHETDSFNVNAVGVHLPTFWDADPAVWFKLAEAQFHARGIKRSLTKYSHILSALPTHIAQEVRDVIMNPDETYPYEQLKAALIKRTTISEQKRLEQLLSGEELGDRKPSQLLRRLLQILDGRPMDAALMRQLFLQRLPPFIRSILVSKQEITLEELADLADEIISIPQNPHINAITNESDNNSTQILCQQIELLNRNLARLNVDHISRNGSRNPYRRSFFKSSIHPVDHTETVCWYHATFREKARRCKSPCNFKVLSGLSENDRASQ